MVAGRTPSITTSSVDNPTSADKENRSLSSATRRTRRTGSDASTKTVKPSTDSILTNATRYRKKSSSRIRSQLDQKSSPKSLWDEIADLPFSPTSSSHKKDFSRMIGIPASSDIRPVDFTPPVTPVDAELSSGHVVTATDGRGVLKISYENAKKVEAFKAASKANAKAKTKTKCSPKLLLRPPAPATILVPNQRLPLPASYFVDHVDRHAYPIQQPAGYKILPTPYTFFKTKSPAVTSPARPFIPRRGLEQGFVAMSARFKEWHERFWTSKVDKSTCSKGWSLIPETVLPKTWCYEDEPPTAETSIRRKKVKMYTDAGLIPGTANDEQAELSIEFWKDEPIFEIWDMGKADTIAIPFIVRFNPTSVAPDIRCLGIVCTSFDYDPRHIPQYFSPSNKDAQASYYHGPTPSYVTCYKGHTSPSLRSEEGPLDVRVGCFPEVDGIVVHNYWLKGQNEDDRYFNAWIPFPTEMFVVRTSRTFRLEVAMFVGPDETGNLLKAQSDLLISRLERGYDME